METVISSTLTNIVPSLVIESFKLVYSKLFNKNIENILINKTDFESIIETKILFEEFPEIEAKPLSLFLKSGDVESIVLQIFDQGLVHKSLEEIKYDFCLLFSLYFELKTENCDSFASNLFNILIEGCKLTLNEAVSEGIVSAHDAKTQFRLNLLEDKIDRIENNTEEIRNSIDTLSKPKICKFVNWREYFSKNEIELIPALSSEIPTFKAYLHMARNFILSQTSNIFIIHSPGGYGKSHLLREIASTIYEIDLNREVFIVTPGFPEIKDAISNEIAENKKCLLIFDDADRYLEELKPLLSYISFTNKSIKVILSARTSGLQGINEIINQLPCKNSCEELVITKWSNEDLIQLLRIVAGKEQIDNEEIIINTFLNPYLIVWIGKQIKNDQVIEFNIIKNNFVNDINYEAEKCLNGVLEASTIKNFVLNLSLIVPFSQKDDEIVQNLSVLCSQNVEKITKSLDILIKIGLLRIVGNSLRFNPDMKGDLYLAYNLKEIANESTLKELIEKWIFVTTDKVFINLSAASKFDNPPILKKYCSGLLNDWVKNADNDFGYTRIKKLKLLQKIVHIVPDKALDLMYTYLDSPLPQISEVDHRWLNNVYPTTDDYGPIVIRLLISGYSRENVLEFISELYDKKVKYGTYDSYKPNHLISTSISPTENNLALINSTLEILQNWVINSDKPIVENISSALSELLSGTHIVSDYGFGKTSWRTVSLEANSELISTRRKAIAVVKTMLNHHNLNLRLSAIEIINNIGRTHSISENGLSLATEIRNERGQLIDELSNHISIDEDFRVLYNIEKLFLEWWALEKEGTDGVSELLKKFPQNIEYIIFKYFYSVDFVIEDFSLFESKVPKEERNWYINNYLHNFKLKSEDVKHLAISLNNKYASDVQIIGYLSDLHQIIEINSVGSLIIDCWVRINPDIFISIRKKKSLWELVPGKFQNIIDFAISCGNEKFIQELYDELFSNLPNVDIGKIDTFLRIIGTNPVEENFRDSCIIQLIEKGNSDIRKLVVDFLYFIYGPKNEFNFIVSYLQLIIRTEPNFDAVLPHNIFSQIDNIKKYENIVDAVLLRSFKRDLIEKLKCTSKLDWYANELLDYSFSDIDTVISFLETRIFDQKKIGYYSTYQGIPHDGLESISNHIYSLDDYDKLLDSLLLWNQDDTYLVGKSINFVMDSVIGIRNSSSNKLYAEEYIMHKLERGDFYSAVAVSEYLPFEEATIETLINLAKNATTPDKIEKIRTAFLSHISCGREGIVSIDGNIPPILVAKKNLFHKMYNAFKPGKLRIIISECIEEIDANINKFSKDEDEFLNEKRY
ncbi:MAG: hypothetical protein RBR63_00865 [Methanosarcina vacuolata]|jgi:hypothetical protein|nr:hypothetical protein [Methanosarcina vacuolata]